MIRHRFLAWKTLLALAAALAICGCAQQVIVDRASTQLREGNFEGAIASYQDGVKSYPDSSTLRSGLISSRAEVLGKLVAEATQRLSSGNFDDAEKTVQRALAIEPKNDRLLSLQTAIGVERRQQQRLAEANSLAKDGRKDQALRVVESALRENPRQSDLVAAHRRLESEVRIEGNASGRRELAETRPISLDFRGAPIAIVLEAMTRGSGINFILDRDVKQDGRVTIFMKSAKVEDAIDLVTATQQLARRIIDPQTVLIYPNTPEKQREHQEQVIRVFHLGSADAKTTAALLRSMLRIKEPFVDERANLVAIRENPEIVALAERLVALHDLGEAEVMMEVEVLEVKTSRLSQLGINFPNSIGLTPLPAAGATGLTLGSLRGINSDRIGVDVGGLLLNLRREVGDFNILANPRIRTKSREKARIVIGDKVPVITATTSQAGFVSDSVSYLDVGLKLEAEPIVSPEDEVTIKLGLEVSSITKQVQTSSGSLAYQIGTRNANTTLRLRDGETQLLGGLINKQESTSANRLPGLGDLPIAGRLFSNQLDNVEKTELVLAITPRILRTAPRPDIAEAEMWVGTEAATRLRPAPGRFATAPATVTPAAPVAAAPTRQALAPVLVPAGQVLPTETTPNKSAPKPIHASWESPTEVKVGETFEVTLSLSSDFPLRGTPLEIGFPTQLVDLLDVSEGQFFRQEGGSTSFTSVINAQTGRVGASVLRQDASTATGQMGLVKLRLKAKSSGSVDLYVTSLKPIGVSGTPTVAELPVLHITAK